MCALINLKLLPVMLFNIYMIEAHTGHDLLAENVLPHKQLENINLFPCIELKCHQLNTSLCFIPHCKLINLYVYYYHLFTIICFENIDIFSYIELFSDIIKLS